MNIRAQKLDGTTVGIGVDDNDTIHDVKKKIIEQMNIDSNAIDLVYRKQSLEDDKIVDDYVIGYESMVKVITKIRMEISVKRSNGETFKIRPMKSDKISDVKALIHWETKLPTYRQILMFEGRILEDDETVEECKITNNSEITVKELGQYTQMHPDNKDEETEEILEEVETVEKHKDVKNPEIIDNELGQYTQMRPDNKDEETEEVLEEVETVEKHKDVKNPEIIDNELGQYTQMRPDNKDEETEEVLEEDETVEKHKVVKNPEIIDNELGQYTQILPGKKDGKIVDDNEFLQKSVIFILVIVVAIIIYYFKL